MRSWRWRSSPERSLKPFEEAAEGVGFGRSEICEKLHKSVSKFGLGRPEHPLTLLCKHERLSAPIIVASGSSQKTEVCEAGDELRGRSRRNGRTTGKFSAHHLSVGDRLKRQILGDSQGWIVRSK